MSDSIKIPVEIPTADEPAEAPEPTMPAIPPWTLQWQALADVRAFVRNHGPLLPEQPYVTVHGSDINAGTASLQWFFQHEEDGLEQAITTRRAIGGTWDKSVSADTIYLRQKRGSLSLTIAVDREQACTRRVVGTREVEVPAQPAVPATTRVVEDVEWDCHPLLDPATDAL